jgi:hypothetical protein
MGQGILANPPHKGTSSAQERPKQGRVDDILEGLDAVDLDDRDPKAVAALELFVAVDQHLLEPETRTPALCEDGRASRVA